MRKKENFKKKHPKEKMNGLQVKVYNNNIEGALKVFKRMVKNSGLMLELKEKAYYEKPSTKKRHAKALQKARYRYKNKKEK